MVSPTAGTLDRLLEAAGFELRIDLLPRAVDDSHMPADVRRILSMTPEDCLLEIRNLSSLDAAIGNG